MPAQRFLTAVALTSLSICACSDENSADTSTATVISVDIPDSTVPGTVVDGMLIGLSADASRAPNGEVMITATLSNLGEVAVEVDGLWELQISEGTVWRTVGYLPYVGTTSSDLCETVAECESAPAIVTLDPGDSLSRTVAVAVLPAGTYRVVYPRLGDSVQTVTTFVA